MEDEYQKPDIGGVNQLNRIEKKLVKLITVTNEAIIKQRTSAQNRSLHLYFELVAEALNNAGLDIKKTLEMKPTADVLWSKGTVKEILWRPIQEAQLQKHSTKELNTKDIDLIYDALNLYLSELGIHEPFPSLESIFEKMLLEEEN